MYPVNPLTPNIYIFEILLNIAQHLPFASLAAFSLLPQPAPEVPPLELRRRIHEHLKQYIPSCDIPEFFNILEETGAAITGSFVRRLLLEGNEGDRAFKSGVRDLNLVVERFRQEPITNAMIKYDYDQVQESVGRHYKNVAYSFTQFIKLDEDMDFDSVRLTVAEKGILSVILSAPTTADMTFITANDIISFFPRMMLANECMVVDNAGDIDSIVANLKEQGQRVLDSNRHWKTPCGSFCPMRWRKTFGDEGMVRFRWHARRNVHSPQDLSNSQSWNWRSSAGSIDDDEDAIDRHDIMYRDQLKWRIWNRCENPNCSNAIHAAQRAEFLQP
ncbi:hypothetical protein EST38_g11794 [Candolleomyces aberdarensis]|uniref:Uncharacterized protein n=1 Tax=Candolleomyces aberdarensis TaxID=2316362 RepID=A0A4Q2D410_9AGAR|nr:hypothetical protein EST38_g11794 [Candolleomyces aberdarensis]